MRDLRGGNDFVAGILGGTRIGARDAQGGALGDLWRHARTAGWVISGAALENNYPHQLI
jgi:hypothetical protein